MKQRLVARVASAVMATAAAVVVATDLLARTWEPGTSAGVACLALGGAAAARLAGASRASSTPRLAPAFVVAALVAIPLPAAWIVALAALVAGRGDGLLGVGLRGLPSAASSLLGILIAGFAVETAGLDASHPLAALGLAAGAFVIAQGFALGVGRLLDAEGSREARRMLLVELVDVPLGFCLALLALHGGLPILATVTALALAAQALLRAWSAALIALRASRLENAAHLTELDTLHAIGREVVSSLDPERVMATVDRECRKIFDVDACLVAIADRDSSRIRLAFGRRRGERAGGGEAVPGLLVTTALRKRGLLVDEFAELSPDSPLADPLPHDGARAAMAAPLLVEGRAVGVLAVTSGRARAYDEHHLAVLTTIAQQAAVALENAHHYQQATVDSLTGCYLRDYFFRRLREEYGRARRYGGAFSVLMIDLDGFKEINDRHGHVAGDQFLRGIARVVRGELRAADLACRYGGDEFCILLPETELEGARIIAERIRRSISEGVIAFEGASLRSTASIGLAVFPGDDTGEARSLVRSADEALYRAKRAGRDCVVPFAA